MLALTVTLSHLILTLFSSVFSHCLALFSEREKEDLIKEMSIMASFEHSNVMSLLGVCLDADMPLLIMPFMSKGSVLEHVRQNKEEFLLESQVILNACYIN